MTGKEVLIANLRKQMEGLSDIPEGMKKSQEKIGELIEELQDESKTGTPPTFDSGSKTYEKLIEEIVRELRKNIGILKKAGNFIQSLQKKVCVELSDAQEFDKE